MFNFVIDKPIAKLFLLGVIAGYKWAVENDS
ncbi:Uncharacterised protein [Shewanella baltica]|nr:Uncharacterised protein [Shewanella baltica]